MQIQLCADLQTTDWVVTQKKVIRSVHRNFYVDDFLMSLPDEKTAVEIVSAINRLLAKGGFRLHKWMFASRKVITSINPTKRAGSVKEISGDSDLPCDRALGMNWNVERDSFTFDVDVTQKEAPKGITRRHMLSTAASLFDSLGFFVTCTFDTKAYYARGLQVETRLGRP